MKWLRDRDPELAALRRAARAAIVMPAMFAIAVEVIGNVDVATFAAFGSFAMLLLVDFTGRMRQRLLAQLALALAGAAFVAAATLLSQSTAAAALGMAIVGFGVIFAGVVSSVLAGATTALLLAFILPVSLPGDAQSIPDRLAGWGMASAAALLAVALLWPAPVRNPLRAATADACRALAGRLRSEAACALGHSSADEYEAVAARAGAAVAELNDVFFATPYRPSGLSTAARTVIRLVDELKWLNTIVVQSRPGDEPMPDSDSCAVIEAAAAVLDRVADLLEHPEQGSGGLDRAVAELASRRAALESGSGVRLSRRAVVSAHDPAFRAQELSYVVSQIATNAAFAAAAERRSWVQHLLGRRPAGEPRTLTAAQERAGSHLERHSIWLRNSIRGGIGLGLAVLIARATGVQHSFWVVLGTLSVLRSNALSTGQDVIRALAGTLAGFVVGAALVAAIGTSSAVLWALLPPAVLLAGLAPATVSFAAGQAAFTLTLLILFNLLSPAGWAVGLVRIEDIALGSAISLAVGLLFWPRGAATALGAALASAYADAATYLARAVELGTGSDPRGASGPAAQAAAASRRLDDTFRTYLAERGAKPMPLADVASLVTGVAGLRLAGDAVLDLWDGQRAGDDELGAARHELLANTGLIRAWYDDFADGVAGRAPVPDPLDRAALTDGRLAEAVGAASADGGAPGSAVRMVWTADHLDAARQLQDVLVRAARHARATSGA